MKTFYSKSLILNRLKEAYNIKKDTDLACLLGISKSTLSNWVSRDSIDYDRVFSLCEHINIDWLFTGEGNMLRNAEHFQALSNNQPQNPDIISLLKEQLEKLTNQLEKKQEKIERQERELGMLQERLKSFEEERKQSEDAEAADVAAVG